MFLRSLIISFVFMNILHASYMVNINGDITEKFTMGYIQDEKSIFNIEQISNMDFSERVSSAFSLGYPDGKSWFKITIKNPAQNSNEDFILYFNETYFEEVNFYEYLDESWKKHSVNLFLNINDREIQDRNPAFAFKLKAAQQRTFYIQAFSKLPFFSEIIIYEEEAFYKIHRVQPIILYMFYFGSILVILLINAFLFIRLKNSIYGFYFGYVLFQALFIFLLSGISSYTFLQNNYYLYLLSGPFFMIFFILFSNVYLEIEKYAPIIYRLLKVNIYLYIFLGVLILFDIETFYHYSTYLTSISFTLLLYGSIYMGLNGSTKVFAYLIAITVYITSMVFFTSMANGWIDYSDFTRYTFLFASFFEVLLFTFLLVDRFNSIQKELLITKSLNEASLMAEVEKRSKELTLLIGEKEILLKEIHHRVKNNFQLMTNVLWFESEKKSNSLQKEIFTQLLSRIYSMSNMHELIHNSKIDSYIDSKIYIEAIVKCIQNIYVQYDLNIKYNIESVELKHDDASSLGIIISEILVNAIKHHPNRMLCKVDINFICTNNMISLSIEDNGFGFIKKEINTEEKIGLILVEQFSNKLLNSTGEFTVNQGTVFRLNFNLS